MLGKKYLAALAAVVIVTGAPADAPARTTKRPDVRAVIAALREAGIDGVQRVASHESEDASYLTTATAHWNIWVFKPPTKATDEIISGKGWQIDLTTAKPGRLYWTRWVSDHTLDPILPRNTGSYRAVSIYGDNIVLVYRQDTRRGAKHRTRDNMPGAWIIVDETLRDATR